jgi:argininosuccinate lyase
LKADAGRGFTTATDLADWLVRVARIPFREAHHITGQLVKMAENKGCDLADIDLAQMQSVEASISQEVYSVLGVDNSVASRTSEGGTAPANVTAAAKAARKRFLT